MRRPRPLAFASSAYAFLGFAALLACSEDPPRESGDDGTQGGMANLGGAAGGSGTTSGTAGTSTSGGTTGGTQPVAGSSGAATSGAAGASAGTASGTAGTGGSAGGSGGIGGAMAGASSVGGAGAGAGGAGGSDPAGGSGPAGAAGTGDVYPGTIIVTDSFDAGASGAKPDATKWAEYGEFEQGSPVLDTARSHSPPNSARATPSMGGGLGSFLVPASSLPNPLPAPGNRFYVRVWMSWEKATPAVTGHGGFIVGASSRDNSGTEARLGISNPGFAPILDMNLQNPADGGGGEVTRFSNGYTTGGNPGDYPQEGFQFEAMRWYCVEVLFNGGGHEFQVWVDDTEVPNMHITDFGTNTPRTMWSPTYTFLKIGGQDYGSQLGSIWYDDVFVGTEPIGCARAVP